MLASVVGPVAAIFFVVIIMIIFLILLWMLIDYDMARDGTGQSGAPVPLMAFIPGLPGAPVAARLTKTGRPTTRWPTSCGWRNIGTVFSSDFPANLPGGHNKFRKVDSNLKLGCERPDSELRVRSV